VTDTVSTCEKFIMHNLNCVNLKSASKLLSSQQSLGTLICTWLRLKHVIGRNVSGDFRKSYFSLVTDIWDFSGSG